MKPYVLLLFIIITISELAKSQVGLEWAVGFGANSNDEGKSIAIDATGNVYTIGYFNGTVDFDPSLSTYNLTAVNGGSTFISKLDANGNFIWAKQIGRGSMFGYCYSISVDILGNVYTTGTFLGAADFDPSTAIYNLTSGGSYDIFICKLDVNGGFIWAKKIGGIYEDRGIDIILDTIGHIYITGFFAGTVDFDPSSMTYNLTSLGNGVFISKLDTNGNFIWAKNMGGPTSDSGFSIELDAIGNVYVAGSFQGTADFDPGIDTFNLVSFGDSDAFITKLDTNGNLVWAKNMGGIGTDVSYSIALDIWGNIYFTGFFSGTADFDPSNSTFNLISGGSSDIFICKLNTNGNLVWAKNIGGATTDYGYAIATDLSGNIYTTGNFEGVVDFDPGIGIYNLSATGSIGQDDIFISKLDVNGNFVWAKSIGGTSVDFGNAITVDVLGNVYITGTYNGTANFDPSGTPFNISAAGGSDIFVLKFSQILLNTEKQNIVHQSQIKIYPNPTTGILHIENLNTEEIEITILDNIGRILDIQQLKNSTTNINIHHLPTGIYNFNINDGKELKTQKIVKW